MLKRIVSVFCCGLVSCFLFSSAVFAAPADKPSEEMLEEAVRSVLEQSANDAGEVNQETLDIFEEALNDALKESQMANEKRQNENLERLENQFEDVAQNAIRNGIFVENTVSDSYDEAVNTDGVLNFSMTTGFAIPDGCPKSDLNVSLEGNLFAKYTPDRIVLNSTGEEVIANTGRVESEDGQFIAVFEFGPNYSTNGYVDFYQTVSPFSAESYLSSMVHNGNDECYAEPCILEVDGRTVVYQHGQYTDFADGTSEVWQCNMCVDFGNDTHLGIRVYNFVPLSEYEQGRGFIIDDGIVDILLKNLVVS